MTLIYTLLVICGFILLLCGFIVLTGKMLGQSGEIDVSVNQNFCISISLIYKFPEFTHRLHLLSRQLRSVSSAGIPNCCSASFAVPHSAERYFRCRWCLSSLLLPVHQYCNRILHAASPPGLLFPGPACPSLDRTSLRGSMPFVSAGCQRNPAPGSVLWLPLLPANVHTPVGKNPWQTIPYVHGLQP